MQYTITLDNPLKHILKIELNVDNVVENQVKFVLPIWRPGRYEAAYYSKNLRQVQFFDKNGKELGWSKSDANTWLVDTSEVNELTVKYEYFAFTMDAGNSWYDENLVYINFINCLLYDPKRVEKACELSIELPQNFQVGCGLDYTDGRIKATDYYELVDNPLLASNAMQHLTYEVKGVGFNIWLHGKNNLNNKKLISDFKKFSEAQIESLGGFPEDSYHFLIITLPYKHYHGVEHARSTVICLGPGNELSSSKLYPELLGVSSHELFHVWNIIKIRPKEMMPYSFAEEVTFPTGYVAEGFTTYFGDLYLSRGNVFDAEAYFNELNTLFNRHFWNYGRHNESVITSSLNLWIDGYVIGAPYKKSSIYVEGAMIALSLDLLIREKTKSRKSLDDVMRLLWKKHGATGIGYNLADIQHSCEEIAGVNLKQFFDDYVYDTKDKQALIEKLLQYVGCELKSTNNPSAMASDFGLRGVEEDENNFKVMLIAPESIGEKYFSVNDTILSINDDKPLEYKGSNRNDIKFLIERNCAKQEIVINRDGQSYFKKFYITKLDKADNDQKEAFSLWTGQPF